MRLKAVSATEAQEQRALVKWIRLQGWYAEGDIVKQNNEGKRSEGQKWNLIHMGMCVGASDIFIAYPCNAKCGLWLEVKRVRGYYPKGPMKSPHIEAQARFLIGRRERGYAGSFCFGFDHGRALMENYLAGCDIDLWGGMEPLINLRD